MGVLLGRGGGDIHVYNILQGLGALGGGRTRYATPACRGVGVLLGRGRGGRTCIAFYMESKIYFLYSQFNA